MSVATQRAAFVNGVLLNQRQQQHAIDVANVQILYFGRNPVPLKGVAGLPPAVQVGLHPRCNDLKATQVN